MGRTLEADQAVRGQTGEFVQLLTGAQSRLYTYVCALIGTSASARDVLQETNVVLWDKAHEYDRARPFLPWAYGVAYLQVLAYRKRCARSRLVFDEHVLQQVSAEFLRTDDIDLRLEALGQCLDKLPRPNRELLDRRYIGGESVDQIARGLQKMPNAVSASLYRIRKLLVECIEARLAAG